MNLTLLKIDRSWVSGELQGRIVFNNNSVDVTTKLSREQVEKIFLVCSDLIEDVATESEQSLSRSAIDQKKLIKGGVYL